MEDPVQSFERVAAVAVVVLLLVSVFGLLGLARLALHALRLRRSKGLAVDVAFALPLLAMLLCYSYARFVEADWLETTTVTVETAKLRRGEKLRIVLLSDLHVDRASRALAELPSRVNALSPDLIIYTGDSLNSAAGLPILRATLSALHARLGRFAVKGNHDVWYWSAQGLFGSGVAEELTGEPRAVEDGRIVLCGAPFGSEELALSCLSAHPDGLSILALHTPDAVEDAAHQRFPPDLYLAGHTHGGQIRLPFYGAVETASRFGKKYEMGRYQVDKTTLFVTRGIGFEPGPGMRIRFLCRPEIAVIDLVGTSG